MYEYDIWLTLLSETKNEWAKNEQKAKAKMKLKRKCVNISAHVRIVVIFTKKDGKNGRKRIIFPLFLFNSFRVSIHQFKVHVEYFRHVRELNHNRTEVRKRKITCIVMIVDDSFQLSISRLYVEEAISIQTNKNQFNQSIKLFQHF